MQTVKDYLKHPMHFLNALLGRPNPVDIPAHQVTYTETPGGTAQPARTVSPDDPLHQDLEKASSLLKKVTANLPKVALPIASKDEVLADASTFVKTDKTSLLFQSKFKKIIPILIFGFILLLLVIVGIYVVVPFISRMGKTPDNPIVVTENSPTPIEFEPTVPSVYATDPEIIKLEEEITVLDREIVGTQLRETTLNAPLLDFGITF